MNTLIRKDKPWVVLDEQNGTIRKRWLKPRFDERWLSSHVTMLDDVVPGRVLSFGADASSVYVDMVYVPGPTVREWMNSRLDSPQDLHDMMSRAIRFWIDTTVETFPYAHWDWTGGNTIVVDEHTLAMIDWDQCRSASVDEIKHRMMHTISLEFIHGDSYKYAPKYLDLASQYFDDAFRTIGK